MEKGEFSFFFSFSFFSFPQFPLLFFFPPIPFLSNSHITQLLIIIHHQRHSIALLTCSHAQSYLPLCQLLHPTGDEYLNKMLYGLQSMLRSIFNLLKTCLMALLDIT